MTTTVVYGDTSDGYIRSMDSTEGATYSEAREGIAPYVWPNATAGQMVGQAYPYEYQCYEGFLAFDTSAVGTDTVSAAVLKLTSAGDYSTTNFVLEVRLRDWGTSLTAADYVAGSSLSGLTLLAHYATSSNWVSGTAYDLVDDALASNVNKTGSTRMLLHSDRHRAGTAPSGNEYVMYQPADATGTTSDPTLTITHAASSNATGTAASTFKFSESATGTQVLPSYVSVANVSAHDLGTGNFSIELWYKRASADSAGYLFYEPGGAYIESLWDGSIYFGAPGVSDAGVYAAPDDVGVWHHVVVTKGATATAWKFYFDGADVTPEITSSTPSSGVGATKYFASNGSAGWPGSLDETAIYKSVLSAARVTAHYNAGRGGVNGTATSTFKFSDSATGAETISGPGATTFKYTVATTGIMQPKGTAASTWKFSDSATGSETMAGTSAATFKYTVATTGVMQPKGTAASTFKFAPAATGAETIPGTSAATFKFSDSATGSSLSGTTGTSATTFKYTHASTGSVSPRGTSASTFKFSPAATGAETISGLSAATFKYSSAATGNEKDSGTAASTWRFSGAGTGAQTISGSAASTFKSSVAATGVHTTITGTSAATFKFSPTGTGTAVTGGTAASTFKFSAAASGTHEITYTGAADTTFRFSSAATGEQTITGTSASGPWKFSESATGTNINNGVAASGFGFHAWAQGTFATPVTGTGASEFKFAPFMVGYQNIVYTGTAASGAWKFAVAATGAVGARGTAASTFKFSESAAGHRSITGTAASGMKFTTDIIGVTTAAGSVIGESHLTRFPWSTEIVKVTGAEGLVTQRSADTTWVTVT